MLENNFKKQFSFNFISHALALDLRQDLRGFTLIEVLLVVTIFAIILSSAISLTTTQLFDSDLRAKSLEVAALVETARNNSATGYRGDVWSIKVLDSDALCDNSGDCILLFKSRDFDDRDTSYDSFVQFDQTESGVYINTDQENEFYFDYKSGWLFTTSTLSTTTQHIVLNSNFGEQESIVVYPTGTVSTFICGEDKVFDVEGTGYITVKIGSQCWMAENLNTGTMINNSTNPADNSIIEKWCYSDTESNCDIYGGLYNWSELMSWGTTEGAQGICPAGWHVPSDTESDTLRDNYDSSLTGYNLKIGGASGFNLPFAGYILSGVPTALTTYGYIWSSTTNGSGYAWTHEIRHSEETIYNGLKLQTNYGLSVRCLKDY